ncbi:MAG: GntR family transcriptional regulator [Neisseriaceae bacterium]|nr:GntR family transcriptional regulator [Neisseriaceae bacterium]MBP6863312.1 GntR family transcriptional regulator [Neisseriaceae bacterium]
MLEKNPPLSLPAIIKHEMMHDIMSGKLNPGDKIIEEEYAHRLNVSRAPVREAALMLITDGLATKIQNRGTILRHYTIDEHIDLYHIRYFIEKLAMDRLRTKDDFTELVAKFKPLVQMLEEERDNLRKINILNEFCHYTLISFADSPTFTAAYPSIYISAQLLQYPEYAEWLTHMATHFNEHHRVITAFEQNNLDVVDQIIDLHHKDLFALLHRIQRNCAQT